MQICVPIKYHEFADFFISLVKCSQAPYETQLYVDAYQALTYHQTTKALLDNLFLLFTKLFACNLF